MPGCQSVVDLQDATPRWAPPSLTLSPLSSTVVIEDENGDDQALKNGTEKTPAEA